MISEDTKNSRIVGVIGAVLFIFSVTSHFAFAYTITPSSGEVTSPVSVQIDFDNNETLYGEDCINTNTTCYYNIALVGIEGDGFGDSSGSVCQTLINGSNSISENTNVALGGVEGIGINFYEDSNCSVFYNVWLPLYNSAPTFTFTVIDQPPQSSIWGSSGNGFWGSTTVTDVTDTLEASVQATGVSIYPLLTFVGIPLGFLIAGLLIYLINKTLTPEKETVINSNLEIAPKRKRGRPRKYDLIYHSVEDLEFKRNYGRSKDL